MSEVAMKEDLKGKVVLPTCPACTELGSDGTETCRGASCVKGLWFWEHSQFTWLGDK